VACSTSSHSWYFLIILLIQRWTTHSTIINGRKHVRQPPRSPAQLATVKSENVTKGCQPVIDAQSKRPDRTSKSGGLNMFRNHQRCYYANLRAMSADSPNSPSILEIGAESTETFITNEALRLLDQHSTSPTQVMERYTQYIHHWLPIIDLHPINNRIKSSRMQEVADAELASLLLCIHLASQPSSTETREQAHMQKFYIQTQKIFSSLQLTRKFSIETIQCGLLLTAYQIGAGMLSDAYVTLSITTGLARAGRILDCYHRNHDGESSHEVRVVWWAIFLLDR
jgi:hypothetical protein